MLPLARPILVVFAIVAFISIYADFLIASVMLTDKENYTLAVGLEFLAGAGGQRIETWGLFAAGALIGALPIVTIFLLFQKYLIGVLTAGAAKG